MRELKFRAWLVAEKRMVPVREINFGDDGRALTIMFQISPREPHRDLVHGENGRLIQYTGLKDVYGKEIYDGNIVRWDYKGLDYIRCVRWDTDQAMFLPNNMKSEVEIIGHMYEHPELLKYVDGDKHE